MNSQQLIEYFWMIFLDYMSIVDIIEKEQRRSLYFLRKWMKYSEMNDKLFESLNYLVDVKIGVLGKSTN